MNRHFWRSLFALTFLSQGALAFLLPTHKPEEYVARAVFIVLGLFYVFSFQRRGFAIKLIIASACWVAFWVTFAFGLILTHWPDPIYAIHAFYLPYWALLFLLHFRAIKEITDATD